ncbi:MAG: hypothetical protein JSR85_06020 [Proteobacteria bacterium]|nr:hypothetical protein [Pseudomonadota bacterium]
MKFAVIGLLSLLSFTSLVTSPAMSMKDDEDPTMLSPRSASPTVEQEELDILLSKQDYPGAFASLRGTLPLDCSDEEIVKFLLSSNGYDKYNTLSLSQKKWVVNRIVNRTVDVVDTTPRSRSLVLSAAASADDIAATPPTPIKVAKAPLVVFLNPSGVVGDLESSLFAPEALGGYTLLVPDAGEYEYNWFPLNVDLMPLEVVVDAFREAEPAHPGILGFAHKSLLPFMAKLKINPIALGELQETNPIIIEAKAKGYLEPFISILAGQFSDFIWKSYLDKIDNYITTNLKIRGLNNEDLILGGCSFGAITALQLAFKRSEPCRAVIATNGLCLPPKEVRSVPRNIFMSFGEADEVIPFWMQLLSYDLLKRYAPTAEMFTSKKEGHAVFPGSEQLKSLRTQFARHIRSSVLDDRDGL